MLIELIKDNEHPSDDELNVDDDIGKEESEGNHFDKFLSCGELAYHKSCYNWILIARLAPRKNPKNPSGLNNFMGKAKGMTIFVGNFTYISDFMIVKDISSVIDPRVSHVVLGKPFVELSGMTYDSSLGVVRLTNGNKEIAYKMPHKIEEYDSLSNDEKENMKSVYLRNDEDTKKGVDIWKTFGGNTRDLDSVWEEYGHENNMYLVKHCACKYAPIRSPMGIEVGLREHLAPMKHPDKMSIEDRGGFGALFANRVWGWRVVAPP
uniref:Protein kinase-like domain, concanavalin A-like lectin/glucanase domain protein n=1 Tax=Tanacetum cinerariifolium TaxID=118510 RepID=A0A6L2P3I1_TANCI|nr:protein kinase-like domain, concanavalin A-like lectin/glucanase domain protein [Tanacetum cinerariifolium]